MKSLPGIRMWWIGASALFIGLGAYLALRNFPGAGFAMHPTGQFDRELFGFAASVAVPMAAAQCAILATFPRRRITLARGVWVFLWLPFTSAGIIAMILPLWSYDAIVFQFAPWMVAVPILPGAALLGFLQWVAAYWLFRVRYFWITLTIVGAVIGSVAGLILALAAGAAAMEIVWAVITGVGIATPQGILLERALEAAAD